MNTKLWRLQIALLKYAGLWPSTTQKNAALRAIFWLHFTGTVVLLIIFEIISLVKFANNKNFVELVKTFGTTAYHIFSLTTMLLWLQKFPVAVLIYKRMNRESFKIFCASAAVNRKFVKSCFARAELWSRIALFAFVAAAAFSILNSYIGVCLFPEKRYSNESELFLIRVKPYDSYTFLNVDKVSVKQSFFFKQAIFADTKFHCGRLVSILRNQLYDFRDFM